jgi:hypothetical protein
MTHRLPKKLSPKAKKLVLMAEQGHKTNCLVNVSASSQRAKLGTALQTLGAEVSTWNNETNLISLTIPDERLVELATLNGILYVDVGERYSG